MLYIESLELRDDRPLATDAFPGNLEFVRELDLKIDAPVTFFVGENGSGKSTLLEAMAVQSQLPITGGSTNEIHSDHAFEENSILADSLQIAFRQQPLDRYFFRAETMLYFASLLDQRKNDPGFVYAGGQRADPYENYGGQSLHRMSHGEMFLSIIRNRFRQGLFLMDEPESALSPQRQLTLLTHIHDLVCASQTQFFIATHSPILLTYPGASIISFDSGKLAPIALEDTSQYRITRGILSNPEQYWHHLTRRSE